jgi:hypothetical protein
MIGGKRLVVVTPAGRRRYLEILSRYVFADAAVDRWDIWLNTRDAEDEAWIRAYCASEPRARLVQSQVPFDDAPVAYRIHTFFSQATDPDAVYVRLDDDIVYAAPGAVADLALTRLTHPDPVLVYGNVANSALTSWVHQKVGNVSLYTGVCGYDVMDPVGWGSWEFAAALHDRFLMDPDRFLLNFYWWLTAFERHSINVISWLGADAARWVPHMDRDEEAWLSCVRPREEGRPCLVEGQALFVHYAFYSQRGGLDENRPDILASYRKLAGL